MSLAYASALALASGLIDVTVGYPRALARRIGGPSEALALWLGTVRAAGGEGALGLALYLAPVAVAAAALTQVLPEGPLGFAATALLCSLFCGRQSLDSRARATAALWEERGRLEAMAEAESLGTDEAETRLARAVATALAARFADEVAAPTLFILLAGLPGAALTRALAVAGRQGGTSAFARAVAAAGRYTLTPAARLGALWIALACGRAAPWRALAAPAPRPTAPAQAAVLAALGEPPRDDPAYLRRALALYRRAAAAELAALAALALAAAFAAGGV